MTLVGATPDADYREEHGAFASVEAVLRMIPRLEVATMFDGNKDLKRVTVYDSAAEGATP